MSEEHSNAQHHTRQRRLSTPLAIIIAGALIAGALYMGLSKGGVPGAPAAPGQPSAAKAVDIKDVKIDADDPFIGEKNARVTLVYWFDYQCPFCRAVDVGHPQIPTEPALLTLIKEYVDTGKLRIVFKDYPFLSEDSTTAALYSHAVWEKYPSRFLEWHQAMMTAQDEEHGGFGDEPSIVELSNGLGLDGAALKALVAKNKDKYTKSINENKNQGTSFGITGTPGFITGKTLLPGAMPLADFKSAIDAQL